MAEQRISELSTISIESSMTEKQTEKRLEEKQNRISMNWRTTTNGVMYV